METDKWIEKFIKSPAENPEDWLVKTYQFGNDSIRMTLPANPDKLLDDPDVHQAQTVNDYMPYWAYIWPSAYMLASDVMTRAWDAGTRTLEIGCGLGLAGVAALKRGHSVTFSDYTQAALSLADYNARLNGFTSHRTCFLDWNVPPSDTFALILGADVLYEHRCRDEVLSVLDNMLARGGIALLADACRPSADPFAARACERGYSVREIPAGSELTPVKGRIFELKKMSRQ